MKKVIIPSFSSDWQSQSWKTQLSRGISSTTELLEQLQLHHSEPLTRKNSETLFKTRVPHSFVARMRPGDWNDPLLLQVLSDPREFDKTTGFSENPLQERPTSTGLLHKYHSRVLLILAASCAINCRYCFRRHFPYQKSLAGQNRLQDTLSYLQSHPEINEVILSGGDPLLADNDYLRKFLIPISSNKKIQRIRIHTRLPIVLPARIDQGLINLLSSIPKKIIVVIHTNHANEINLEVRSALLKLHNAQITLLNQSVLLKGVNDCADILSELSESLFKSNVLPYYLHQLDKVSGTAHFQVTTEASIKIYKNLLEQLPGFLVPKFVQEIAGTKNKWPIDIPFD